MKLIIFAAFALADGHFPLSYQYVVLNERLRET